MTRRIAAKENIELTLPVNAAYVSAARLTASSIASRLGFNIEEIEDIKAAVSEVCAYIIKKSCVGRASSFRIVFSMTDRLLEIRVSSDINAVPSDYEEEISLQMVKALMDTLILETPDQARIDLLMRKNHKENEFSGEGYLSASSLI
jgi:serine/threonine-protein kinase RsbW